MLFLSRLYQTICLPRTTLSTGYYGLSLNTSRLHADPYISCFLSAAVEVPAYISSWLALQYVPRRLSVICMLLLAGISLFFILLVPQSKQPHQIFLGLKEYSKKHYLQHVFACTMLISGVNLGIFTWLSVGIYSLLEPASSGHLRNCTVFGISVLASFLNPRGCQLVKSAEFPFQTASNV